MQCDFCLNPMRLPEPLLCEPRLVIVSSAWVHTRAVQETTCDSNRNRIPVQIAFKSLKCNLSLILYGFKSHHKRCQYSVLVSTWAQVWVRVKKTKQKKQRKKQPPQYRCNPINTHKNIEFSALSGGPFKILKFLQSNMHLILQYLSYWLFRSELICKKQDFFFFKFTELSLV